MLETLPRNKDLVITAARPRVSLRLSEKQVTEQCLGWLRSKGWYCVRLNSGLLATPDGRRIRVGEKGLFDWICVKGEKCMFVEFKATGKVLSPDQDEWLRFAAREGIPAIWCDGLGSMLAKMPYSG